MSRLKKIDTFLDLISSKIEFSRITPINRRSMQIRFTKTSSDPQFEYSDVICKYLDTLTTIMSEISLGNSYPEKLLRDKCEDLVKKINLIDNVGTSSFTAVSKKIYPVPSEKLVKLSYSILKIEKSKKQKKIPKKDAEKMIKTAFKILGVAWKTKNSNLVTSARVNNITRTLELKRKERFSEKYVRRLIVHEIGTHALRAENGALQPFRIFFHGFPNYLETEEGLAAYSEYITGILDTTTLRNYAGRVVAVNKALTSSFSETYKHLRKYFSDKMSWKLTLRAKRGLADTSKPGAYTKDVIYLRGFLKVKKYVDNGGDLKKLYYGKIGIDDISWVEKIQGVVVPSFLPFELFMHGLVNKVAQIDVIEKYFEQ